jgi:predicted small secreted protein
MKPKKEMIKRVLFAVFIAAVLSIVGAGCHTAHGAGEDISNAGQTIQENTPP